MATHSSPTGQTSSPSHSADLKENKNVSSRRLKKREIDRRCQRQARERTKTRIAYLEGLVEDFRRQDSSGQVATLMAQLQELAAERERMAKALKDIQKAMDIHKPLKPGQEQAEESSMTQLHTSFGTTQVDGTPGPSSFLDDAPMQLKAERVDIRPQDVPFRSHNLAMYTPPPDLPLQLPGKLCAPEIVRFDGGGQSARSQTLVQSKAAQDPDLSPLRYSDNWAAPRLACSCHSCHSRDRRPGHRAAWQGNLWIYANEVLSERFDWGDVTPASEAISEDVPIRAVLEGWDAVARRGPLHPSWQILRRIDQSLTVKCPSVERVAVLRAMHLLLQFHTESTTERYARLPPWYMRRPSQNLAHSYAIDYFPWPGVRERFIFNEHDYCGNEFWHLLSRSMRVLWPYELRDCYTREVETGLYKISPLFEQRISDIRSWTMGPDFFRRYPELYTDIPAFSNIPHFMSPKIDPGQKRLLSAPPSPEVVQAEEVYEVEEDETKPIPPVSIPIPVQNAQVQVNRHQRSQATQPHSQHLHPHSQHLHPQHDLNQHLYNISDFNPLMALDTFPYGAVSDADFANIFQPEMPENYPNVIY